MPGSQSCAGDSDTFSGCNLNKLLTLLKGREVLGHGQASVSGSGSAVTRAGCSPRCSRDTNPVPAHPTSVPCQMFTECRESPLARVVCLRVPHILSGHHPHLPVLGSAASWRGCSSRVENGPTSIACAHPVTLCGEQNVPSTVVLAESLADKPQQ